MQKNIANVLSIGNIMIEFVFVSKCIYNNYFRENNISNPKFQDEFILKKLNCLLYTCMYNIKH